MGIYKGQVGVVTLVPDRDAEIRLKKADGTMVLGAGNHGSHGYVQGVLVHPASADQIALFIQQCTLPAGWQCGYTEAGQRAYFYRPADKPVQIFWEWPG